MNGVFCSLQADDSHPGIKAESKTKKRRSVQNAAALFYWSGLRGSNPPPSAWEADTLPDELNPRSCLAPKGKNCYILYHRNSKSQGRFGQGAPKRPPNLPGGAKGENKPVRWGRICPAGPAPASPPHPRPAQKRRAAGAGACRSPFCPPGAGLTCSGSSCRNGARPRSSRRSSGW